jgi:hypothetical protein
MYTDRSMSFWYSWVVNGLKSVANGARLLVTRPKGTELLAVVVTIICVISASLGDSSESGGDGKDPGVEAALLCASRAASLSRLRFPHRF